jgi:hypothetical protein
VFRPRFELNAFRIQARSVTDWANLLLIHRIVYQLSLWNVKLHAGLAFSIHLTSIIQNLNLNIKLHNFKKCPHNIAEPQNQWCYCRSNCIISRDITNAAYSGMTLILNLLDRHQCRSQWPRDLRHKPSSPARTLGLWVRILLEARMSVWVYSMFMFFCV